MLSLRTNRKVVSEVIFTTLANLVTATAINLLAWQYSLISGGLTGFMLFINRLTAISVGTLFILANFIFIVIAYLVVGRGAGIRAIYGFVSLSIFIDFTRGVLNLTQHPYPGVSYGLPAILALSLIMGTTICVVLANNFSLGGYSTVYIIVSKYFNITAQQIFFILDASLAVIVTITSGIEAGLLLGVNAICAFYVVRIVLPRMRRLFDKYQA